MAAFIYPITIKREPQNITYSKIVVLDDEIITLKQLTKYVKDGDSFSITGTDLRIFCKRLETVQEVKRRVAKEELYMAKYEAAKIKAAK